MDYETVLVTGGAGFVGSALAEHLLQTGRNVIVIDNLHTGSIENCPSGARFIRGDISKKKTYQKVKANEIDAVFHLAAQSSGEASFDDPEYDFESHVKGTFELLRWCSSNGITRFIYASSMSVYGDPEYLPVEETHPVDPKTYYAAGKLGAESYVKLFENHGMNTTIFRMFSIYGPGQNMENMKQGMVSIYLRFLLEEDQILVKGPLDRFRDFIYIDDVVDAWITALKDSAAHGETFNLARGKKVEVKELLETMLHCAGEEEFPIEVTDGTPGDQFGIYGDVSKIQERLGWTPEVSLEEGLNAMIEAESRD